MPSANSIPTAAPSPDAVPIYPRHESSAENDHKPPVLHRAAAPPPQKIPMVKAIMGAAPFQAVQVLQLLAGLPLPANLGANIDTGT